MTLRGLLLGLLLLGVCPVVPVTGAEVLGTATLSLEGGFDSNRYEDSAEEGSGTYRVEPRLALAWFASPSTEVRTRLWYARREFLESGFGYTDCMTVDSEIIWGRQMLYVAPGFGLRWYRDSALPEDDHFAISFAPRAWFTDPKGREYFVHGYLEQDRYSSALNLEGVDLEGLAWELRPGISVPLSRRTSVSLSGLVRGYTSNEKLEEYSAYGGILDLAFSPTRKWRTGLALRYVAREYRHGDMESGESVREDDRVGLNAWSRWRIRPWLDLFTTAAYASRDGSLDIYTYDSWSVRTGVSLTAERAVVSTR